MSLSYLLDGYNIIHHLPALEANKNFEDSRLALVRLIEVHRPQGSLNNSVMVVFDGHAGSLGHIDTSTVKVVFSQDESADERIKRIVAKSTLKKSIVVVTNDKDIKFSVRSQGACVMSVEEFLNKMTSGPGEGKQTKRSSPQKEDEKYISQSHQQNITSEFEKIWLQRFSPREKGSAK